MGELSHFPFSLRFWPLKSWLPRFLPAAFQQLILIIFYKTLYSSGVVWFVYWTIPRGRNSFMSVTLRAISPCVSSSCPQNTPGHCF